MLSMDDFGLVSSLAKSSVGEAELKEEFLNERCGGKTIQIQNIALSDVIVHRDDLEPTWPNC